jgi:hypothetical protein
MGTTGWGTAGAGKHVVVRSGGGAWGARAAVRWRGVAGTSPKLAGAGAWRAPAQNRGLKLI